MMKYLPKTVKNGKNAIFFEKNYKFLGKFCQKVFQNRVLHNRVYTVCEKYGFKSNALEI